MWCRPGGPVMVEGHEEDKVDEQVLAHTPTTFVVRACTCTHQQLSSRHSTPAAVAIYTGQGLHTSSGIAVGTTTTYRSPSYYVSHPHTHPPPLTCGPHCPSPVPAFKFAHSQPSISEVPPRQQKPNSSGSRRHSTTTNLTRPHYRYRPTHQHPPTPPAPCPSNTSGTHGQRPGSSPGR